MSKQKLTILQVIPRGGISKKTGLPWQMFAAQCVMEQESEKHGKEILVGQINLPESLRETAPGDYLADFSFYQSMDGKLEPRIVSLLPFGLPKARPASGSAGPA